MTAVLKAVAVDLDGVVYVGKRAVPGAADAVEGIRNLGLRVLFVTNNSSRTRLDIASELTAMGIKTGEDDVLSSGYAAARLLRRLRRGTSDRTLVLGTEGLRTEIRLLGTRVVDEVRSDFLVVGLDPGFTYAGLSTGLEAILRGATFIACNRDASYPADGGRLLPGCGSLVAALECASGHTPRFVAGKPDPGLLGMVAEKAACQPNQILMVGDSLASDIAMANRFGSPSVLVRPTTDFSHAPISGTQEPTWDHRIETIAELTDAIRMFASG